MSHVATASEGAIWSFQGLFRPLTDSASGGFGAFPPSARIPGSHHRFTSEDAGKPQMNRYVGRPDNKQSVDNPKLEITHWSFPTLFLQSSHRI